LLHCEGSVDKQTKTKTTISKRQSITRQRSRQSAKGAVLKPVLLSRAEPSSPATPSMFMTAEGKETAKRKYRMNERKHKSTTEHGKPSFSSEELRTKGSVLKTTNSEMVSNIQREVILFTRGRLKRAPNTRDRERERERAETTVTAHAGLKHESRRKTARIGTSNTLTKSKAC
jgi:hypothetical protein